MNQREAKREACSIVARLIDNYLDVGGPLANTKNDVDAERATKAMKALRDELDQRSGTR